MTGGEVRGPALVSVAILLLAALASAPLFGPASEALTANAVAPVMSLSGSLPSVNFTFHGDAGRGWGFTSATTTTPGPNVTVHLGDRVNLTLIADDAADHNWFIDYDNSLGPNGDEPSSPIFNNSAVLVWPFVADRPGNWTYRCRMHPTSMFGTITILEEPRPVNLTLYGNAGRGWGFTSGTISEPGPPIVVFWRTNVTLTLIADDSADHTWFIDYDNSLARNGGEPGSPTFNQTTGAIVWSFIADRTGNWTYRCGMHPTSMTGSILVIGGPPTPLQGGPPIPLISGIMLAALGVVLAFAAVYHVRAVRAAKRMK